MLVWKNSSEGEKRILAKCEAIVFISEVGFERCPELLTDHARFIACIGAEVPGRLARDREIFLFHESAERHWLARLRAATPGVDLLSCPRLDALGLGPRARLGDRAAIAPAADHEIVVPN